MKLWTGRCPSSTRLDGSRTRWRLPPRPFPRYRRRMDTDDDLTDDHMRLLEWLSTHPTGSLAAAAQALDLAVTDVEGLCADLVDAGMIERARMQ